MINRQDIPQLIGLPGGGITTNCLICKGLEGACASGLSEYVKARSAAYYQVSTELAAYKNVEMERAKSDLEEHRLLCVCASKSRQSGPNRQGKPKECTWQRSETIQLGKAGTEYRFLHGCHLI